MVVLLVEGGGIVDKPRQTLKHPNHNNKNKGKMQQNKAVLNGFETTFF